MVRAPRLSLHCLRPVIDWTKCFLLLAFALVYSNLASSAFAQAKDIVFAGGGTTTFDGWSNMTVLRLGSLNYGSWPGNKIWTQAITANVTGSGGGLLNRLAGSPNGGGPFPSDTSVYFGSSTTVANTLGGTLGVSRAPVSGVRTVVFQIELGEGQPQGQTRYFFHEPVGNPTAGRPTLYVNGQPLSAPTHTALVNQRSTEDGGGANFEDPVFVNTYGYQWNISTSNVTSLEVRFSCVEHVSIYSMRLDQTSVLQTGNLLETQTSAPVIGLSGTGLAFGNVVVGSNKTGTLTISNTGNAPLTVNSLAYPSAAFTGNWSGTIAAGGSQNVTVTFTPTAATTFSGNITVSSNDTVSPNTIAVSGTGVAQTRVLGLSGSFAFGNVTVGQTTNRTLTISNSGNSVLTVSNISYPQGFRGSWSNGVIALATNSSTNITVTFAPTNAQTFSGNIMVASDATTGTSTAFASGTGTPPATRIISVPASLDFGPSPVGGTRMMALIISNTGNSPLNVTGISYPSGLTGETNGSSIPSGGNRNVAVNFAPDAVGSFSGLINILSDSTAGSGAVTISGSGVAPSIRAHLSGTPQFDGSATTVTHTFQSTSATWLNVQFTDNLAESNNWTPHAAPVYSDGGIFPVTFSKPGDHRTNWQRGMFFRLSYPTKP
jgi:hypothetical protein